MNPCGLDCAIIAYWEDIEKCDCLEDKVRGLVQMGDFGMTSGNVLVAISAYQEVIRLSFEDHQMPCEEIMICVNRAVGMLEYIEDEYPGNTANLNRLVDEYYKSNGDDVS